MILFEAERSGNRYSFSTVSVNLSYGFHIHNSFELIRVRSGEIFLLTEGDSIRIQAGGCVLLFPNQIHGFRTESQSEIDLLIFSPDYICQYYEKHRQEFPLNPVFTLPEPSLIEGLRDPEDEYLFVSRLFRVISAFDRGREYATDLRKGTTLASKVLSYISENYHKAITLADLARNLGYDYHYLSGCIGQTFHTGFLAMVNEYRISRAGYLLQTTDRSISDIAAECGYGNMRSFNRNFKAIAGTTPLLYRRGV